MRDAGWGMAKYIGPIPSWLGKTTDYKTEGVFPERDTSENISNLKVWIKCSHLVIWIGYFLGSLITILNICRIV
jgi:hypothetical protein